MHSEKYRESPTGIGAVWVRTCILQPERHFLEEMLFDGSSAGTDHRTMKLLVRWAMPLDDTP